MRNIFGPTASLCMALLFFPISAASLEPVGDQSAPLLGSAGGPEVRSDRMQAQIFKVGLSGLVDHFLLWNRPANNPDKDLVVTIRDVEDGLPGSNILGQISIPPSSVGTASRDLTFADFSNQTIWLKAGQDYALVLTSQTVLPSYYNWWGKALPIEEDMYLRGEGYVSRDNGISWTTKSTASYNFDFHFWSYMDVGGNVVQASLFDGPFADDGTGYLTEVDLDGDSLIDRGLFVATSADFSHHYIVSIFIGNDGSFSAQTAPIVISQLPSQFVLDPVGEDQFSDGIIASDCSDGVCDGVESGPSCDAIVQGIEGGGKKGSSGAEYLVIDPALVAQGSSCEVKLYLSSKLRREGKGKSGSSYEPFGCETVQIPNGGAVVDTVTLFGSAHAVDPFTNIQASPPSQPVELSVLNCN